MICHFLLKEAMKRPEIILPVFFLLCIDIAYPQEFNPDPRSMSLAGIVSVCPAEGLPSDNPATLAIAGKISICASHSRPSVLSDIGMYSIGIIVPSNTGTFRFNHMNYGIPGFRNMDWKLGYGMKNSNRIRSGIRFNYHHIITDGAWNYLWILGIDAGISFHINETTSAGLLLKQPVVINNYSSYRPMHPGSINLGLSISPYEKTFLTLESSFITDGHISCKGAIEYIFPGKLSACLGFHSHPYSFSSGIGYNAARYRLDAACALSGMNGISSAISITFFPAR